MWVETCRERVNPKCPVLQKQSPWRSLCLLWPQLSHEPSTWKLLFYVCVHVCTCVCTCLCIWMLEVKLWSHSSDAFPLVFLRQWSLVGLELADLAVWQGPYYLSIMISLPWDYKCAIPVSSMFWGLNSDPCVVWQTFYWLSRVPLPVSCFPD